MSHLSPRYQKPSLVDVGGFVFGCFWLLGLELLEFELLLLEVGVGVPLSSVRLGALGPPLGPSVDPPDPAGLGFPT